MAAVSPIMSRAQGEGGFSPALGGTPTNSSFDSASLEETNKLRMSRGLPPIDPNYAKKNMQQPQRLSLGAQPRGSFGGSASDLREPRRSFGSDRGGGRLSESDNDALADAEAALAACAEGAPLQVANDPWVPTFEMRRDSSNALREVQENCNW
mmetsp:Transcript_40633/g.99821  ORF Transcript_40633/g.99821 Transcript_40633/m.99821 type:complete len:153 (+) Transcript_40633:103-561(+)